MNHKKSILLFILTSSVNKLKNLVGKSQKKKQNYRLSISIRYVKEKEKAKSSSMET